MASQAESWPHVEIYTDGGCDPNPGPGGWGAILLFGPYTKEISGAERATTNNRMELSAAIAALRTLKRPCEVAIYTDSQYLRKGITQWLPGWRAQGWRKSNGKLIENLDLWQELAQQVEQHRLEWHWVKGHRGNPLNERADRLAAEARQELIRGRGRAPGAQERAEHPGDEGAGKPNHSPLPEVSIYPSGCSLGQPGPGGYAAVLVYAPERTQVISGGWPLATSNTMELWAAVAGLRTLKERYKVQVHTGSRYVLEGAERWLAQWERRHWQTRDGQPVKNQELWVELSHVMGDHDVHWQFLARADRNAYAAHAAQVARKEAEAIKRKGVHPDGGPNT